MRGGKCQIWILLLWEVKADAPPANANRHRYVSVLAWIWLWSCRFNIDIDCDSRNWVFYSSEDMFRVSVQTSQLANDIQFNILGGGATDGMRGSAAGLQSALETPWSCRKVMPSHPTWILTLQQHKHKSSHRQQQTGASGISATALQLPSASITIQSRK
jgi:hypothetical protein